MDACETGVVPHWADLSELEVMRRSAGLLPLQRALERDVFGVTSRIRGPVDLKIVADRLAKAQFAFADPNRVIAEDLSHSASATRYYCLLAKGQGGL